jgi:hypothetical protein
MVTAFAFNFRHFRHFRHFVTLPTAEPLNPQQLNLLNNLSSSSPLPRRERPGEGVVVVATSTHEALQPHRPMPKLAVKRMQKATMPIIQRSSGFIVRVLLSGKGLSSRWV